MGWIDGAGGGNHFLDLMPRVTSRGPYICAREHHIVTGTQYLVRTARNLSQCLLYLDLFGEKNSDTVDIRLNF